MNYYNIGDIVTVRDWDEMVKTNNLTDWGAIAFDNNDLAFVDDMKQFCNKQYLVTKIDHSKKEYKLSEILVGRTGIFSGKELSSKTYVYRFTEHMLYPKIEPNIILGDPNYSIDLGINLR